MNRIIISALVALTLVGGLFAQEAAAPAQPAGPQPKSQEEVDAIVAVQNATDPQARADAAQELIKSFPETEFLEFANYMTMLSYQQLNDFENMVIFGEKTLESNADNVGVLISLAYAIPTRTREFDLDKDEKLAKAEDFAKRSLTLIPNMAKVDPAMPDEQWLMAKKDFMAQANESLGLIAVKRGEHAEAEALLKKALGLAAQQDAQTLYNLAVALKGQDKREEALDAVNKAVTAAAGGPGSDLYARLKTELEQAK